MPRKCLKWGALLPVRYSKICAPAAFLDPFPNNASTLPLVRSTVLGQAFGRCPPLLFLHRA